MRGPFKKKGERPTYKKKQEKANREERDRQKHQQYIEAINSIANQFASEQQQDNTSDAKRAFREKLTIGLLIATVVAAGIGDWFFYGQREEMIRAYGPLKKSAEAAERQATAGRAYLFIKPENALEDTKAVVSQTGPYRPSIQFSIKNFGQTPAVITGIKTHLYLANGMATEDPPEPNSSEAQETVDLGHAINISADLPQGRIDFMTMDSRGDGPSRIVFAAGEESGPITYIFDFRKEGPRFLQWAWFYCEVDYQDIFDKPRHTWIYARVGGTGFSYSKSEKYNHWD